MLNSTGRSRLPQRLPSRSPPRLPQGMCRVLATLARAKRAFHNIFRHLTFDWAHYTVAVVAPCPSLWQSTQIPSSCQLARLARLTIWLPQFIWASLFHSLSLPLSISLHSSLSLSFNCSNRSAIKLDCLLGLWQKISVVCMCVWGL